MFLHVGGDYVIPHDEIVAIIDYDLRLHSKITRKFLENNQEKGVYVDVSEGTPKSVIITTKETFLSQISALTLKKRGDNSIKDLGNFLK